MTIELVSALTLKKCQQENPSADPQPHPIPLNESPSSANHRCTMQHYSRTVKTLIGPYTYSIYYLINRTIQ